MAEPAQRSRIHYIHRLSFSARERLVGVFVLAGLAVVIGLMMIKGKTAHLFEERVTFNAVLQQAQGISTQSIVKVSGIEVGRVSAIDISDDNRIHLQFYVLERFHSLIRADSRAELSKLSILGDAIIEVTAGSPDQAIVPEGAFLAIEEPMSMDELMAEVTPLMNQIKASLENITQIVSALDPKKVETMAGDTFQTVANLRRITDEIAAGKGNIGQLVFDTAIVDQVSGNLNSVQQRIDELAPITAKGSDVAEGVEQLLQETRRAVVQVNEALLGISDELTRLPETMGKARRLMETTNETLDGAQRVWPLSKSITPPGNATALPPVPIND